MSLQVILAVQLLLMLIIAVSVLLVITVRQKRTLERQHDLLSQLRDELSGDSLSRHLHAEADRTTANCRQDTIAIKAELAEEDLAISLRYSALVAEAALAERLQEKSRIPWREFISDYRALAATLLELKNAALATQAEQLQAHFDHEKEQLAERITSLQTKVAALEGLATLANDPSQDRAALEQAIHSLLLSVADSLDEGERLRELAYLLHETFYEQSGSEPGQAPSQDDSIVDLIDAEIPSIDELDDPDQNPVASSHG